MSEPADLEPEVEEASEAPEVEQTDSDTDFEAAARKGGWKPKEEFEGKEGSWVDAKTYVLRAAEILPQLTSDLKEARSEIRDVKKTLKDFGEHHSKTAQREYERAFRDIQARLDHAASIGDVEGVRAATDEMVDLRTEIARPGEPQLNPEFEAWKDQNDWYGKDKALSAAFDALCAEVYEEGYTSPKAGLKEALSRLKSDFPNKFENPNRKAPGAVEGQTQTRPRGGKTYSDLPPDAKAICDDFVRRGVLTRERYVRDFFA